MLGLLFASTEDEGEFPNSLASVNALKFAWTTSLITVDWGMYTTLLISEVVTSGPLAMTH